ncbi:MAG: PEGA domain-containing protein [Spirochaetales bacterium]
MKKPVLMLAALTVLFCSVGLAGQAFSSQKALGLFKLEFQSNLANVQVTIDGQDAGTIPFTVYVKPGQHVLGFLVPGQPVNTVNAKINGDTTIPYNPVLPAAPVVRSFPLSIAVNVPGAQILIDNQAIASNPVALTAGNHTLTVTAMGFSPWNQSFNMPAGAQTINVTLQAAGFPLNVSVNVPGATILVDNTAITIPSMISAGPHTLTVTAPGFQPFTQNISMGARGINMTVTLQPASFPLTVRTNVNGANVQIDNTPVPAFPVALAQGNHTLLVTAPGYQPYSLQFTMQAQPNILNITLVPALFALNVAVNVPGALITIDNQQVVSNPVSVTPGIHNLVVTALGYQMYNQQFDMPANPTSISVGLIPELGTIQIKTDGWIQAANQRLVRVFVNDVEQKDKPLLLGLPQGTYKIRLEAGPVAVEAKVTVVAGKTTTLAPKSVVDVVNELR